MVTNFETEIIRRGAIRRLGNEWTAMTSSWTYKHHIHTPATHIPYIEGDKNDRIREVTVSV